MTNPSRIFYLRIGFAAVSFSIVRCHTEVRLALLYRVFPVFTSPAGWLNLFQSR